MSNDASSTMEGSDVDVDVDMDTETLTNGSVDGGATPRPHLVNENAPVNIVPFLGRREPGTEHYDVCIVGAGPAGLMLGLILARLGITPLILDERNEQTPAGRADGLQPKTIETLRMLNIADELLHQAVKVYDICLWHSAAPTINPDTGVPDDPDEPVQLRRVGREVHYPAFIVDLIEPFVLIGHQGMVERVFVEDLAKRGFGVKRCHRFDGLTVKEDGSMEVQARFNVTRDVRTFGTSFVVGCDGAHSRVRKMIVPSDNGARDDPSEMSVWGVLDGELDTDFPDIWTKAVVFSERYGSILILPRERDMTRLYIEMRPDANTHAADSNPALVQAAIMQRAAQILQPYRIRWRSIEWFGQYRVSQRVAPRFAASLPAPSSSSTRQQTPTPSTINTTTTQDNTNETSPRIFIAGDAAHTHSPKAAQGMNTALHDSWNLAWKLNFAVRGLARAPVLLDSYSSERQKIARDLITFDLEHANEMSRGNPAALADNFRRNIRFISGVGCEYGLNEVNLGLEGFGEDGDGGKGDEEAGAAGGALGARPGCTLPPGKVSRYIDANPIDVQLDIPVLGQFRVYFFVPDILSSPLASFLMSLCDAIAEPESLMSRLSAAASKSYLERPRVPSAEDLYIRPERYTAVSQLFAFALITSTSKHLFEIAHLPPILSRSPWTIYLDDVPDLDTRGSTCTEKYLGSLLQDEVAIMNVRPDGYVGSLKKWKITDDKHGEALGVEAARWLESYYDGFLQVPPS
ncbi:3-hydroxybenzoate 4-monooxygenase [Cytospora mali]|uniref:3-hydroxybenzoate 4-monooxygenase n=1 Tax=Cytospora mali TaxID=578113 RepID=A0A194V7I8_CYTMA|nr:3-hydroxybenzoate 4-monooxygenase [Valsa mali var. pyri (nom. inval.)]